MGARQRLLDSALAVLGLRTLLQRDEQLDRFFAYSEQLLPETE